MKLIFPKIVNGEFNYDFGSIIILGVGIRVVLFFYLAILKVFFFHFKILDLGLFSSSFNTN